MIRILVGDISSTLEDPQNHQYVLGLIRLVCRARPANYQFMPKYKAGLWDGYISVMHGINSFPTGLLSLIEKTLMEAGYETSRVVRSKQVGFSAVTENTLAGITLRDYQVDACNKLLNAKRGVAKMATNSGKTEVMAACIKAVGMKSMVIVHRKELMHQTAKRFIERGLDNVGIIGDGVYDPGDITVAMIQTLANKLDDKLVSTNTVLFADETHHLQSDQMMKIFNKIPGCYRFGVSGTPLKYDTLSDMRLMAATGDIICEVTNKDLIDMGFSAKPVIKLIPVEEMDSKAWNAGYRAAYDKYIVNSEKRNKLIAGEAIACKGGIVLILVNRLDHGNILQAMIPGSIFVNGSDSTETRASILNDMKTKPGVYIASPIFDEGIDVPGVETVIIAGGGKSHIKLLQRIGRGLRQKEGRNELSVIDFIDDTNQFLLDHSDERISTYVAEGFQTIIT